MKKVLSKDETEIAYDNYGKGPPLIYITGAICHRSFFPVKKDVEILSEKFTVYNYDRRGRGDSGNAPVYSLKSEVEDIEALINAAGGSSYILGHSSGAVLALEAALQIPNKVLKVVAHDVSYVFDDQEKLEYSELYRQIQSLIEKKENSKAIKTFLLGIGMPKLFVYLLPIIPGWKKIKDLAPTLEYDLFLTCDKPPLEHLSKIKVPTNILYGEKCPRGMHEVSKQIARVIPNCQLNEMQGQNHMADTKVVLEFISDFLLLKSRL